MKLKDLNDLRNKTTAEIDVLVAKIRTEISKGEMDLKMHRNKNTNLVKNLKKNLAQMLSIRKETK
ncbi:50S ribosomal protein L29 [Candidatus Microgenomates bacterium]|nr:50S ribosomal protein L29 [Candidatus Microgenomates bacterium]